MSDDYPFAKEKHLIHIRGLEATLADRNRTIEQLRSRLDEMRDSPETAAETRRSYKRGWKDCAGSLMEVTRKAALGLREIRQDAFDAYIEGDKR